MASWTQTLPDWIGSQVCAGFHGAPSRAFIDRHRARPVLSYRACEFAAGVGGWPTIIGGLSIPYATIPMDKSTGMTIGGTRYFMVFPLLENWMGGSSRHHFSDAVGALGGEPERNVVGPALQHAGEYCRR